MPENIIHLNEEAIKNQLSQLVRGSVEETLNNLLDEEADRIANAARYERNEERKDTRAGYYDRKLLTKAGEVKLKVPRLRHLPLETAIIERYKRRESSIEEALIEMYLAGVSVRRIEDITEALWGTKVSAGTVSNLNQKVYGHIGTWRNRPLQDSYPYVYLDGIYLKRAKEDKESWLNFLRSLKERGLKETQLFVGDKCLGLVENIAEIFPEAYFQRCVVHFYRNIFSVTPHGKMSEVAAMLKAIHAQEDIQSAREKAKCIYRNIRTAIPETSGHETGGIRTLCRLV